MAAPANNPVNNSGALNNDAFASDPAHGIATNPVQSTPNSITTDPLSELRPLHLPDPVSWWPPAPGWWMVAALILIIIVSMIIFIWRHRKNNRYRRMALNELETIKQNHANDPLEYCQHINRLLKRIALSLWPREKIAGLHGKAWVFFLNAQCKAPVFSETTFDLLANSTYQPVLSVDSKMIELVYLETQQWIKQHRRPEKTSGHYQKENRIVSAEPST